MANHHKRTSPPPPQQQKGGGRGRRSRRNQTSQLLVFNVSQACRSYQGIDPPPSTSPKRNLHKKKSNNDNKNFNRANKHRKKKKPKPNTWGNRALWSNNGTQYRFLITSIHTISICFNKNTHNFKYGKPSNTLLVCQSKRKKNKNGKIT